MESQIGESHFIAINIIDDVSRFAVKLSKGLEQLED